MAFGGFLIKRKESGWVVNNQLIKLSSIIKMEEMIELEIFPALFFDFLSNMDLEPGILTLAATLIF